MCQWHVSLNLSSDMPHTTLAVYTVFFTFLMLMGLRCHLCALGPWSLYNTGISVYQDLGFTCRRLQQRASQVMWH
jgi:hypothetical protein